MSSESTLRDQLERANATIALLRRQMNQRASAVLDVDRLSEMTNRVSESHREIDQLKRTNRDLQDQIRRLQMNIEIRDSETDQLPQRVASLAAENLSLKERLRQQHAIISRQEQVERASQSRLVDLDQKCRKLAALLRERDAQLQQQSHSTAVSGDDIVNQWLASESTPASPTSTSGFSTPHVHRNPISQPPRTALSTRSSVSTASSASSSLPLPTSASRPPPTAKISTTTKPVAKPKPVPSSSASVSTSPSTASITAQPTTAAAAEPSSAPRQTDFVITAVVKQNGKSESKTEPKRTRPTAKAAPKSQQQKQSQQQQQPQPATQTTMDPQMGMDPQQYAAYMQVRLPDTPSVG